MARTLHLQIMMRQPSELVIDQWNRGPQGIIVAGAQVCQ